MYQIIIIDDVKAICNSLRREILKISRDNDIIFNVIDYQDPILGLEHVLKSKVDLVISDIKMAYMSGDVLINKIKESLPDIPIIVITGFATKDNILSVMKADKNIIILTKPWETQKLIDAIGKMLSLDLKHITEDEEETKK